MLVKHKSAGTELTQAEYEALDAHEEVAGVVAIDPPNLLAGTTNNVDVAVAGLLTTHKIVVECQGDLEYGIACVAAYCPVDGTLRIRLTNFTGGAIDPASRDWAYIAF